MKMAGLPLKGKLVVSLEQAVAAPYCSSRLADAGARVIKIERAEGDFARGYDSVVHGESAYFVWLNRGKESLVLDIKNDEDASLLQNILSKADVFIQNLAPGAAARSRDRCRHGARLAPHRRCRHERRDGVASEQRWRCAVGPSGTRLSWQAQHALAEHVALNLVGAAIDGVRSGV